MFFFQPKAGRRLKRPEVLKPCGALCLCHLPILFFFFLLDSVYASSLFSLENKDAKEGCCGLKVFGFFKAPIVNPEITKLCMVLDCAYSDTPDPVHKKLLN